MAKVIGKNRIEAVSSLQATLMQREHFNAFQVGHGQYDQHKHSDDFDEEMLHYTPFKKEELFTILNTHKWKDPVNVDRLLATFPSLDRKISDETAWKMTEKLLDMQPQEAGLPVRRIAALFQDCQEGRNGYVSALQSKETAYRALLALGVTAEQATQVGHFIEEAGRPTPFKYAQDFDRLDPCSDPEGIIEYTDSYKDAYLEAHPLLDYDPALQGQRVNYDHADTAMFNEYMESRDFRGQLIRTGLRPDEVAAQKNAFNIRHNPSIPSARPTQGMVLYISCTDMKDYRDVLRNITHDLVECGADFSVANTRSFDSVLSAQPGRYTGRFITLYEGNWDAAEFFARNPELLEGEETGISVSGAEYLGGRVSGRYSGFAGRDLEDPETGILYREDPAVPYPPFVVPFTVDDFILACEGKDPGIIRSDILEQVSRSTGIPYEELRVGTDESGGKEILDAEYHLVADLDEDGTLRYNLDLEQEKEKDDGFSIPDDPE